MRRRADHPRPEGGQDALEAPGREQAVDDAGQGGYEIVVHRDRAAGPDLAAVHGGQPVALAQLGADGGTDRGVQRGRAEARFGDEVDGLAGRDAGMKRLFTSFVEEAA